MRRFLCLGAALALAFRAIGSAQRTLPPGSAPGHLINVAGTSFYIRCAGSTGGPMVILEAGAGDYSNRWSAVQDLLKPRVRSCTYDRAGLGWSGGTQHESIAQIAPEKAAEQEDLLQLSNHSKIVRDPSSGHHAHVENPGLVANAIVEVVDARRR
jgi:pimeloyl-ACP methyl ester carboxylesterase